MKYYVIQHTGHNQFITQMKFGPKFGFTTFLQKALWFDEYTEALAQCESFNAFDLQIDGTRNHRVMEITIKAV